MLESNWKRNGFPAVANESKPTTPNISSAPPTYLSGSSYSHHLPSKRGPTRAEDQSSHRFVVLLLESAHHLTASTQVRGCAAAQFAEHIHQRFFMFWRHKNEVNRDLRPTKHRDLRPSKVKHKSDRREPVKIPQRLNQVRMRDRGAAPGSDSKIDAAKAPLSL